MVKILCILQWICYMCYNNISLGLQKNSWVQIWILCKLQDQTSEHAIVVSVSEIPIATNNVVPMPHIKISHMITNNIMDETHVDLCCLSL